MLRSAVPDEDLAPPPSDEDIFGQIESIKQQFAEENQQLNRQLEENKVRAKMQSSTNLILHICSR